MWLSDQLELVAVAGNVGPADAVPHRRENDEDQLPALQSIFVFAPDG